jgi:DNA replication protein DnaC
MSLCETYLDNSLLPKRYLKNISLIPAKVDEQVFKELNSIKLNIKDFVDKGENLLICSNNCGNGKTTWATKMIREYISSVCDIKFKNNCPALFINVTNFLNEKKLAISDPEMHQRVIDVERKILTAKLVVFDDLGVKDVSQYDMGNLYYWIDERTNNMRSCIFTSNLMPKQLKQVLDERLYSRIVKYSIIKEIKDGDNRNVGEY